MDFVSGINRDQIVMVDFETKVETNSWARKIDLLVEALPISELGFNNSINKKGRPRYRSQDMLKLVLYGYRKKIFSNKQLEEACKINIEVIWLLRGLRPSISKISSFKRNNCKEITKINLFFLRLIKEMNLVDGKIIDTNSFKSRVSLNYKK